jgi:hypothetical protein
VEQRLELSSLEFGQNRRQGTFGRARPHDAPQPQPRGSFPRPVGYCVVDHSLVILGARQFEGHVGLHSGMIRLGGFARFFGFSGRGAYVSVSSGDFLFSGFCPRSRETASSASSASSRVEFPYSFNGF